MEVRGKKMSSHKFEEKLSALGIVLDDRQKEQFDLFYEILVEWNARK